MTNARDAKPRTCLSCSSYRTTGCAKQEPGWPTEELDGCWVAQYEPGSDEAEDWEHDHQADDNHQTDDNRPTNP